MKECNKIKVAVVGAGIYGSTISIKLKNAGLNVDIYDNYGILNQASSINQFRIHHGYHYPRSFETIKQIQKSNKKFLEYYKDCIFTANEHLYAISKNNSKTSSSNYEKILNKFSLPYKKVYPEIFNYSNIDSVYKVDEKLYDPRKMRSTIKKNFKTNKINFIKKKFSEEFHNKYDYIIYADYGLSFPKDHLNLKLSLVEKCFFKPPKQLQNKSIVIIDGPYTAFDTTSDQNIAIFGSAKFTNLLTFNIEQYEFAKKFFDGLINKKSLIKTDITNYKKFVNDCEMNIPLITKSKYLGSKYTFRVIEHNPTQDKRVYHIKKIGKIFYVFSGKVVSCISAAEQIIKNIKNEISR